MVRLWLRHLAGIPRSAGYPGGGLASVGDGIEPCTWMILTGYGLSELSGTPTAIISFCSGVDRKDGARGISRTGIRACGRRAVNALRACSYCRIFSIFSLLAIGRFASVPG